MRILNKLVLSFVVGAAGIASAQAAGSYDGRWSVQLVTQRGDCSPSYNWSVAVSDGRIADSGMFIRTAGAIDQRGRVKLQITEGADVVAAFGLVSGATAQGAWRSPTRQCSGAWTAARS